MIYDSNTVDDGLHAVMFPVREVAVFAETEPGRKECIPGKKALINDDTRRVLSVVSDQYQVLHNRTALRLARKCCTAAFPNTAPASWEVFSVETPKTGGHCRVDFKHDGKVPGYDWSFSEAEQDTYGPFIRVTNSYNRTCLFGLRFGLVRWACTNGWIDWHSSIAIAVAHDVKEMEASIEAKISEAKFRKVHAEFLGLIGPLRGAEVQRCRFRPIMQSVLQIRKPQGMPTERERAWQSLEQKLDDVASKYVEEFGETAYALMNAISDVATHPPTATGGYNFIRRERDALQRSAGVWLGTFSRIAHQQGTLAAYLANPSPQTLQSGNGRRT